MAYTKKRREACVLFLDEGFSAEAVAVRLREAGFIVERFHDWFKDEAGQAKHNVSDPEIIRFCQSKGWLLVTLDHEMRDLHRREILRTEIAILATANNNGGHDVWVSAIISMKSLILREFKTRERPWFATFSRESKLKVRVL